MKDALLRMYIAFQTLIAREEGQDLVEYALIISLIAVVAVASLNTLSASIVKVFTNINAGLAAN